MCLKLLFFFVFLIVTIKSQGEGCKGAADICIAIDGSTSVTEENFIEAKKFVYSLANDATIGPDNARIGVVQFGTNIVHEVVLSDSTDAVLEEICGGDKDLCNSTGIPYRYGPTPTDKALEACKLQFQIQKPKRNVQKFVIVLTDGTSDVCAKKLCDNEDTPCSLEECLIDNNDVEEVTNLKEEFGAIVIFIGVSTEVKFQEEYMRDEMATQTASDRLYAYVDFAGLQGIVSTLTDIMCLEMVEIEPQTSCYGENVDYVVEGRGFLDIEVPYNNETVLGMGIGITLGDEFDPDNIDYIITPEYNASESQTKFSFSIEWDDKLEAYKNKVLEETGNDYFYLPMELSLNYLFASDSSMVSWSTSSSSVLYHDCSPNVTEEVLECVKDDVEACRGQSDIVFVLDNSWSVDAEEWNILKKFVYNVTKKLCVNDLYQYVSFIEFTTECEDAETGDLGLSSTLLDLTGERDDALITALSLPKCRRGIQSETPLHAGLKAAYDQLSSNGRDTAQKYVIVVSDGETDSCLGRESSYNDGFRQECLDCLDNLNVTNATMANYKYCTPACCYDDNDMIKLVSSTGALVFGIAVGSEGEVDRDYIQNNISSYPTLYAESDNYDEISEIISILVEKTCLDVYTLDPPYFCLSDLEDSETNTLRLKGNGFLDTNLQCKIGDDFVVTGHYVTPADGIDSSEEGQYVDCEMGSLLQENLDLDTEYFVEVSINGGQTWTNAGKKVVFYNCSNDANITDDQQCDCAGESDIVFVVDASYSVDDSEWSQLSNFVLNVTKSLCIRDDSTRVSVIEFTTGCDGGKATTLFDLSGNRVEIIRQIRTIGRCGKGETPLHSGLKLAYEQLKNNGRSSSFKYVIVLTDGVTDSCKGINVATYNDYGQPIWDECDPDNEQCGYSECIASQDYDKSPSECYKRDSYCCGCDQKWVKMIEEMNAFVFSIAVGEEGSDELDSDYMEYNISSYVNYFARVDSYEQIKTIQSILIESTCVYIFTATPEVICLGKDVTLTIRGLGFVDLGEGNFLCSLDRVRVDVNDTSRRQSKPPKYYLVDAELESKKSVICNFDYAEIKPGYDQPDEGMYQVAIVLGGTYSNYLTITLEDCSTNSEIPRWIAVASSGGLMVVLLILLCLASVLLFSLCALSKKKKQDKIKTVELSVSNLNDVNPLPEPEPEPEPEAYVPQSSVDRSTYYLGGRALTVDWEKDDGTEYDGNTGEDNPFDIELKSKRIEM